MKNFQSLSMLTIVRPSCPLGTLPDAGGTHGSICILIDRKVSAVISIR